jgi:SAM-dependent methyltransferase
MNTQILKQNELRHFAADGEKPYWHKLPASLGYWAKTFLSPKIDRVFGSSSIPDFFAKGFALGHTPERPLRLLSLGSGLCVREEETVRLLLDRGYQNVHIECLEMSPVRGAAVQKRVAQSGMAKHLSVTEQDMNEWTPRRQYDGVMANHSLHHFLELERIFAACEACLADGGRLAVNDMIGRNGHRRWPEVLEVVNYIWSILPEKFKFNHILARLDDEYDDADYSKNSFEGIRSQDILPLLNERFRATHLVAEGGVVDMLIDRKYGHNFDPKDAEGARLLDEVGFMNDALIDIGLTKPTMLLAWFEKRSRPPTGEAVQHRHWSQEFCARQPDNEGIRNPLAASPPAPGTGSVITSAGRRA